MTRNWSATLSCSSSSSCCGTNPTRTFTSPGSATLACPKTCTPPVVGGVNPSISSSKVVLPAPFLPSTPMTSPGATSNDRSRITCFAPKDLPRLVACTAASIIAVLPVLADALDQLRLAQFELFGRQHGLLDQWLDLLQSLGQRRCAARLARDRHRHAAIAFQQALRLQQAVGLGNRHGIHGVFDGQLAHRRQFGAGRQLTARDHAARLLEDLPVDRNAGLRVQYEHADAW